MSGPKYKGGIIPFICGYGRATVSGNVLPVDMYTDKDPEVLMKVSAVLDAKDYQELCETYLVRCGGVTRTLSTPLLMTHLDQSTLLQLSQEPQLCVSSKLNRRTAETDWLPRERYISRGPLGNKGVVTGKQRLFS